MLIPSRFNRNIRPQDALHKIRQGDAAFRTNVAIIGGNDSYKQAPFNSREWEIWCCNSLWGRCKDDKGHFRADRWFEMHPMSVQTDEEIEDIKNCPIPIYTLEDESKWAPNSVKYPIEQMRYDYFTCTFGFQIALAIHLGFSTIALYGVELEKGTSRERTVEKSCTEFWIGYAEGKGIDVQIPKIKGSLCQIKYMYGYDYWNEFAAVEKIVDEILCVRTVEYIEAKKKATQLMQGFKKR